MLNYRQGEKRPFLVRPTGHRHHGYLETDKASDLKDPATGCIKVRGEGSVIRPKAQGGDVAEKSLVGRPCNRILEKLGKSGCPLSPFSLPCKHNLRFGLVTNSCYKNSFFQMLKQAQGLKYSLDASIPARCCGRVVLIATWNRPWYRFGLDTILLDTIAWLTLATQEGSAVLH